MRKFWDLIKITPADKKFTLGTIGVYFNGITKYHYYGSMKGLDENILNIRSDYLEGCISNNIDKKSGTEISVVYNDSDPDINIELVHNKEVSNENTTIISEKLEVKTTKKYKKNLVWDGPRWDLAYFDPTMSEREMKKLRYYESLFKKIDNSEIKGEVSINYKEKIKGRSSKNKKHDIFSFFEGDLGIEIQNLHQNTIKDTKVTDVKDLLLTSSKDKYKQNDLCNSGRYITDKDKIICESATKSLSSNDSTIDRDSSSKRRISIDWRMRLLNRTNLTKTISESNN
ncbi:uncharacterized protein CMU_013200 [Cryptosporidium muris RN66]|uniref:Uncharacterized protein n=1 Tax=Cryptosporidium muris (strain RN66) TaxID=441375 RepID=B6AEM8_CRYMR|nr:uncharacterized protein CMU_013200 [Cryptosporidium muris RN66]EEA06645.1 hypothetical protein CMU_013200 [Cryptosporidium muris RN66]|eukprot:XP_002140994.1 hypothetical protein [Cryptosporidium muris RN66]